MMSIADIHKNYGAGFINKIQRKFFTFTEVRIQRNAL